MGYTVGRCLAVGIALSISSVAIADDPYDPDMTPDEIARDSAIIRQMNQDQLDYVRNRDAGYAQGWSDYSAARSRPNLDDEDYRTDRQNYDLAKADYARQRRDYERQRSDYDRAMQEWREDASACRAGYYDRCD